MSSTDRSYLPKAIVGVVALAVLLSASVVPAGAAGASMGDSATERSAMTAANQPIAAQTAAAAEFSVTTLDAPDTAQYGDTVEVAVGVTNVGNAPGAQSVQFRIDLNGSGTLDAGETVESRTVPLEAGQSVTDTFELSTEDLGTGTYLYGVVTENDTRTAELTVEGGADLAPANFQITTLDAPESVERGEEINVDVGITNVGEQAGSQTVEFRVDRDDSGTLDADETVESRMIALAPGMTGTDTVELSTDDLTRGTYRYGLVTENDTAITQTRVTRAKSNDQTRFSATVNEQNDGATVELSNAREDRSYTVDLGSSVSANDVTFTSIEMFFDQQVGSGTLEFTTTDSAPNGAPDLDGAMTYVRVDRSGFAAGDVGQVAYEFTIPRDTLDEMNVSSTRIRLYRLEDGEWESYETARYAGGRFVAEDVPGFGTFAVAPRGAAPTSEPTTEEPTTTPAGNGTATAEPETADPGPGETETATTEEPATTGTSTGEDTTTAPAEETDAGGDGGDGGVETTGTQTPGFTPVLTVLALLALAFVATRRR